MLPPRILGASRRQLSVEPRLGPRLAALPPAPEPKARPRSTLGPHPVALVRFFTSARLVAATRATFWANPGSLRPPSNIPPVAGVEPVAGGKVEWTGLCDPEWVRR
jgi:hypothetical protein